jgi:hypothetical protein
MASRTDSGLPLVACTRNGVTDNQTRTGQASARAFAYLVEHPINHNPLASLSIHGFTKVRFDLLVVEALEVSTAQKGMMGGN